MAEKAENIEELLGRLAAGAGITLVGSGTGKLLFYAYNVVLARLLGPAVYGVYFLGYVIVFNLTDVVAVINANTIVRFAGVYYESGDRAHLKALTTLSVVAVATIGIFVAVLLIIAAPWLAVEIFDKPDLVQALRFFALSAPLLAVFRLAGSTLVAIRRVTTRVIEFDLLLPVLLLLLVPLLIWNTDKRLELASLSYTVSVGIGALVTLFSLWRSHAFPGSIRFLDLRKIATYSGVVYAMSNLNNVIRWADVWFVGYFLDSEAGGLYAVAVQVGMIIALWSKSFNSVFGPTSAALFEQRRVDMLYSTYRVSTKWSVILALPILLLVVVVGDAVFELLYGAAYSGMYWVVIIVVLGNVIEAGTNGSSTILTTNNYERRELANVALGGIATVLMNLLFIPAFGIIGAALAKTTSITFIQGLRISTLKKVFGQRRDIDRFVKPVLAFGISVTISLFLRTLLAPQETEVGELALLAVISLAGYGIALHLMGWERDDLDIASNLLRRVLGKK